MMLGAPGSIPRGCRCPMSPGGMGCHSAATRLPLGCQGLLAPLQFHTVGCIFSVSQSRHVQALPSSSRTSRPVTTCLLSGEHKVVTPCVNLWLRLDAIALGRRSSSTSPSSGISSRHFRQLERSLGLSAPGRLKPQRQQHNAQGATCPGVSERNLSWGLRARLQREHTARAIGSTQTVSTWFSHQRRPRSRPRSKLRYSRRHCRSSRWSWLDRFRPLRVPGSRSSRP